MLESGLFDRRLKYESHGYLAEEVPAISPDVGSLTTASPTTKEDIPMPRKKRAHLPPVSWLFGRDLMASLKTGILYSVYGTKIDARAWMNPDEITMGDHYITVNPETKEKEFWFDYISDTGDSTKATYSIAYLALSNLYVNEYFQDRPSSEADREVELKKNSQAKTVLPRGQFLFVGGDTTYHMSDYAGLSSRFQNPFNWAFEDLIKERKKDLEKDPENKDLENELSEMSNKRWLFGIPGNHDYYDLLDGFQRQFRSPVREDLQLAEPTNLNCAQLGLHAFTRVQEASYVALQLPFDWRLWGLDTDVGKLDERQQDFFKGLIEPGTTADRLIVATSAPTTVFGQYAAKDDQKASKAFLSLDLPREFLPVGDPRLEGEKKRLRPDQIRLDISGDVHQYARYWGNDVEESYGDNPKPRTGRSKKSAESKDNYASVVSGLGGAFHHPSLTYKDEVREQVLYPSEETSRNAVADKVFNPWNVFQGGWVWAMGFLIAFVIYFSATHVPTSRQAMSTFPVWNFFGIAVPEPMKPAVIPVATDASSTPSKASDSIYFWGINGKPKPWPYGISMGLLILSAPILFFAVLKMNSLYKKFENLDENLAKDLNKLKDQNKLKAQSDQYVKFQAGTSRSGAADLSDVMKTRKASRPEQEETNRAKKAKAENDKLVIKTRRHFYALVVGCLAVFIAGMVMMFHYRENNTPFGNSMMVLLTSVWAIIAVILSFFYSDWLFGQSSKRDLGEREWWVTGILNGFAILSVAAGIWIFGQNTLPAFLLSDISFVVVVLAALILMVFVIPHFLGATHNTGWGEARLIGFGVWHAILQMFVAFLLVRKGTWVTLAIAAGLIIIFMFVGRGVMRASRKGWPLFLVWILYGLIMLSLPWLVFTFLTSVGDHSSLRFQVAFWPTPADAQWLKSFETYEWWAPFNHGLEHVLGRKVAGWRGIVPAGLAGLVGAALCCTWFGWYLGVSSLFDSHYNEAGGAARIEKFKQFVRIRLTRDTLTGYVIAVDFPKKQGSTLNPKLIDVFHLKAKKP